MHRRCMKVDHREVGGGGTHPVARSQILCSGFLQGKWLDDVKGTPEDPEAFRCRLVATQVSTNAREDVTQATPVKGIYPAPDIHEHFTIHNGYVKTAYILTHNFNNLEHNATNCMSAMTHTDVTIAHH